MEFTLIGTGDTITYNATVKGHPFHAVVTREDSTTYRIEAWLGTNETGNWAITFDSYWVRSLNEAHTVLQRGVTNAVAKWLA